MTQRSEVTAESKNPYLRQGVWASLVIRAPPNSHCKSGRRKLRFLGFSLGGNSSTFLERKNLIRR